jgi:hypothetical protein
MAKIQFHIFALKFQVCQVCNKVGSMFIQLETANGNRTHSYSLEIATVIFNANGFALNVSTFQPVA